MNQEGKNMANLSKNSADDWAPKYYSDNRKIVFQSHRDGNWEIYMMKLDGTGQTNLTNHPRTDYSFTVLPLKNP
jgi:TolB protein